MANYIQDQADEIEALESIYSEEIDLLGSNPHEFTIPVKTENFQPGQPTGLFILLKIRFTPTYPDEAPEIEFEEFENLEENHLSDLRKFLDEQIEENLGMVMTFTLVSAAIEWLGEKYDTITAEREEALRRKKEEEDEEERKKLEGTKVTVESFLAWKAAFDEELKKKKGLKAKAEKNEKPTGRGLFTMDSTLNDSDIKFLASTGDTAVTVDESLFEDLDDLDLDDDDEDDPDWCPGDSD